jgi:transcriptional regulator with XRE-family HTH domain
MARGPQGLTPQSGLGKAIRFLRDEAKMTQKTLAAKSGVSAPWISRIEHGEVDPTWATIAQISAVLGVSMESLAELAEDFETSD